jgi:hypothetical protein
MFTAALDETLARLNMDYRTKRAGAQHTVPRVTNDRTVADDLLASSVTTRRSPLMVPRP